MKHLEGLEWKRTELETSRCALPCNTLRPWKPVKMYIRWLSVPLVGLSSVMANTVGCMTAQPSHTTSAITPWAVLLLSRCCCIQQTTATTILLYLATLYHVDCRCHMCSYAWAGQELACHSVQQNLPVHLLQFRSGCAIIGLSWLCTQALVMSGGLDSRLTQQLQSPVTSPCSTGLSMTPKSEYKY